MQKLVGTKAPGNIYIPRLDTFRALACFAIIYHHYFNPLMPPNYRIELSPSIDFFFVLSGFLITQILLEAKGSTGSILAGFYIRRCFRIFPLYYTVLALGLIINIPGFFQSLPWSPFYLVNIGMIVEGSWFGFVSHFWTLSVEEQFYLFWPIVLLSLGSIRRITVFAIFWIASSIAYKYYITTEGLNFFYTMTVLGYGDELMMGSLAAVMCERFGAATVERVLWPTLLVGLPALLIAVLASKAGILTDWFRATFIPPTASLVFVWLTVKAWRDGPDASSWGGTVLPALGLTSYGIYVWHFVLLWPCVLLEERGYSFLLTRLVGVGLTLALAWVSFWYFETPLRQFGRRLAKKIEKMSSRAPQSVSA